MTDFVAVIRRAVDGLKDNTPEMRLKVYDKARAAVRRQLENMNPRPGDELIDRQMSKLEDAIRLVDSDHAEALPQPADEPEPQPAEQDYQPAYQAQPVAGSWQPVPEPAVRPLMPEPEKPAAAMVSETVFVPVPARTEPEPLWQPEPVWQPEPPAPVVERPVFTPAPVAVARAQQPVAEMPAATFDAPVSFPDSLREEPPAPMGIPTFFDQPLGEVNYAPAQKTAPDPRIPAAPGAFIWETEGRTAAKEAPGTPAASDLDLIWGTAAEDKKTEAARTQAASNDIPWDTTPFADPETMRPAQTQPQKDKGAWDDLQSLIGYDADKPGKKPLITARDDAGRTEARRVVSKLEGRTFQTVAKPSKPKFAVIAALVAGIVIVGAGAYGAWQYGGDLVSLVSGTTTPSTATPAGDTAATTPATVSQTTSPSADSASRTQGTEVAAIDPSANPDAKFTQRLLPDGTEINETTAPAATAAPGEEGKSVAQQTLASTAAPAGQTAPESAPAAPTVPADTGVTQKMFLYEERLGQTAPTAIEGTVSWSVQNDTTATGKPQNAIQGKITMPDRGMSALITIKRNTDSSLPASHIVEFVFSLPQNFEGGAIDSIQRIAMKQTEQDRGNALIAVPAKITEDFHMIALNDDPEAVKANVELLKTRNWMDIPLTYRNGRRALITLEKGSSGTDIFNKVMAEWAASGPTAAN